MSARFNKIALIGKHKNPEILTPMMRLAEYLAGRQFGVIIDRLSAAHLEHSEFPVLTLEEIGAEADLAVVIGGDGTMLNIARILAPYNVPLVGVNQGRLGFLTDLTVDTMIETLGAMLDGQFMTEQRVLLSAEVIRHDQVVYKALAFNDIVVHRGISTGMIEFQVRINGEYVYSLRSDGLIVATPTGSTAYALSAGGPILHSSLDLIELVPVCPHTLSNRPIVVGPDAEIEIMLNYNTETKIYSDSHSWFDLGEHDRILVRRFPQVVKLLHAINHSYYRMLREKLGWSEIPHKNH